MNIIDATCPLVHEIHNEVKKLAKENRQMDIRDKLIEKSGYEAVFHSDSKDDHSEMNSIKGRIETNMRY